MYTIGTGESEDPLPLSSNSRSVTIGSLKTSSRKIDKVLRDSLIPVSASFRQRIYGLNSQMQKCVDDHFEGSVSEDASVESIALTGLMRERDRLLGEIGLGYLARNEL